MAFFVSVIAALINRWPLVTKDMELELTTGRLGLLLLRDMVLPFEVIALVLLASLVGAIYFSSKRPS